MRRAQIVLLIAAAAAGTLLLALSNMGGGHSSHAAPLGAIIDEGEPNNSFDQATYVDPGDTVTGQGTNDPITETDFFSVTTTVGLQYRAQFQTSGSTDLRLRLVVYDPTRAFLKQSSASNQSAEISWTAYEGMYYVELEPAGLITGTGTVVTNYTLEIIQIAATPTSSPQPTNTSTSTPTNTPVPPATNIPGADQFEPNHDFDHAATLGTDVTYSANFVPLVGTGPDNDYYRIWVKPGLLFTCETSDLGPGVDPNMIVYDGNRNAIGGNDDVEPGNYNSRFSYFSTYEGWLYVLLGHGGRLPQNELQDSGYKIRCEKSAPGATNTPSPTPTRTPGPTTEPSATPTPTPTPGLTVRPLTTPTPPAAGTPTSRFIPISVLVYYDGNGDGQPGAGEGIQALSVHAYEAASNQLLAQGSTDDQGSLEFTVAARGPVRVSIPYFSFNQLVSGDQATIRLRIPYQALPGATP